MSETTILRRVQVALSQIGARVFRNQAGTYELKDGRWLSSGLCPGASDLIGWKVVTVTPEMVGKRLAVFTAVEVKTQTGRTTEEQENFLNTVRNSGGIAFIARSPEEATDLIARGTLGENRF